MQALLIGRDLPRTCPASHLDSQFPETFLEFPKFDLFFCCFFFFFFLGGGGGKNPNISLTNHFSRTWLKCKLPFLTQYTMKCISYKDLK